MNKSFRNTLAILLASLCAVSASASTSYFSEGHLSLEVMGFLDTSGNYYSFANKPSDINLSYSDNALDEEYITSITGDATAEAVSSPSSGVGQIDLYTSVTGDSNVAYALSTSDSTATGNFEFVNTSSTIDYTVNLLLSYTFSNEVETDFPAPLNNQLASTSIDMDVVGDFNLGQVLQLSEETELSNANFNGSAKSKEIQLSFLLSAGDVENVFASIINHGESESISAVPLPASIFFFGPALLTLVVRKKRPA